MTSKHSPNSLTYAKASGSDSPAKKCIKLNLILRKDQTNKLREILQNNWPVIKLPWPRKSEKN